MNQSEPILKLTNLCKSFGGIRAVHDVNMEVYEGELRCLIGPNGAGKTTMLNLVVGMYPPTSGQVLYCGKPINNEPTWKRMNGGISMKLQKPGVYGTLSLRDNIRIALQRHVDPKHIDDEIERLVKMVGIDNIGNPLAMNMSHGQQQWLEIAMSIALKPKLLLLDEPTAGMGPEETAYTAKLVKDIHAQGITIIFIDHDMDFVRRIAQKVTVLHYGEVFAEGSLAEIENNEDVKLIYLGDE
jgi:branched-chain amino acid transport system ATP-binding protein